MTKNSNLIERLESREKIFITPSHYLKKWRAIFYAAAFLVLTVDVLIVLALGKSFLAVGSVLFVSVIAGVILYHLRKEIKSTYVTGDNLIFKSFDKSSKVTSLRSVRKVKTTSVLGLRWTRLNYNLDGRSNSVLIINASSSKFTNPESTLSEAIDWSKKRKANHKPGSVAV